MPRWVRTALVTFAALAVWLVAAPAFAAAPLCDGRGASGLAAPPTLDPEDASVDIGMTPEPCSDGVVRDASFHEGRTPDPLPLPSMASALPVDTEITVYPVGSCCTATSVDGSAPRLGARDRLERPPRA